MNTKVLNNISYGLFVLSAEDNGKANACIINTAMQQTASPLRISVTVNKGNLTHDMVMNSKKFNLSILSQDATFDVFKHFGFCSGRDTDKISGCEYLNISKNGLVYLNKFANAYLSAEVIDSIDLGTHTLFVADVLDGDIINDDESVTYDYYNKNIKVYENAGITSGFRCVVCGYVLESDTLPEDYVCPVCKHGAAYFEKLTADSFVETYKCEVCGYEWKGISPEKCPLCNVDKNNFKIKKK